MKTETELQDRLTQAIRLHVSGRTLEARHSYAEFLRQYPAHPVALHLLGVTYLQTREPEAALRWIDQAIELDPGYADALGSRGSALRTLGRYDEAVQSFQKSITLNPHQFEMLSNYGNLLQTLARYEEAAALYKKAIRIKPDYAEAYGNLAAVLNKLKQHREAVEVSNKAVALRPTSTEAYQALGEALQSLGRNEEAIDAYETALRLRATNAEVLNNLGVVFKRLNRQEESRVAFERAIEVRPDFAQAHNNLGSLLQQLEDFDTAERLIRKAIELKPDYSEAHYNLGLVLRDTGRIKEAIESYDRAIALNPDYAEAHNNRGVALLALNRHDEAQGACSKACTLRHDYPEAAWNLGLVQLSRGLFGEGWALYEKRWGWGRPEERLEERPGCRLWIGKENLRGAKLLVQAEQGFGDYLQMARYFPLLEERGVECVAQCPPPLTALLQRSFPSVRFVPLHSMPEECAHRVPLMSLPLALGTNDESRIPNRIPYLLADPDKIAFWKTKLPDDGKRKVGLVWRGNSQHVRGLFRSAQVEDFVPFFERKDITCVVMQKELTGTELRFLKDFPDVLILDQALQNFDDTAAVASCLDVVVSIDSSPAHLAGALGKETHILLAFGSDWRWMVDRIDSPWYPTARLYRQRESGKWSDVIREAACLTSVALPLTPFVGAESG